MEPEFARREAFLIAGLSRDFDMSDAASAARLLLLWDEFVGKVDQVTNRVGVDLFGMGFAWPASRDGLYNYTTAVQISTLDALPDGWRGRAIEAQEYAVFTHPGGLDTLMHTVRYVFGEWFPAAGLKRADAPDFELYDEAFQRNEGHVQLWVPVLR